jgi:hypothetical protein
VTEYLTRFECSGDQEIYDWCLGNFPDLPQQYFIMALPSCSRVMFKNDTFAAMFKLRWGDQITFEDRIPSTEHSRLYAVKARSQ